MAKGIYIGAGGKACKVRKIYIGAGGKAHKVKKGYIGVSGVARPFFSAGIEYMGKVAALSVARHNLAAAFAGEYVLFGGGGLYPGYGPYETVDAFDGSFVGAAVSPLGQNRWGGRAASIGGYAFFAGGFYSHGQLNSDVYAYSSDLVQSSPEELDQGRAYLAASVSDSAAIFAGGAGSYGTYPGGFNRVDIYDSSLIKLSAPRLNFSAAHLSGVYTGKSHIFAGGIKSTMNDEGDYTANTFLSSAAAFSDDFVQTSLSSLSKARAYMTAAMAGSCALFMGGQPGSSTKYCTDVDVYSRENVRLTPVSLAVGRSKAGGGSIGDTALIVGGTGNYTYIPSCEMFDQDLVRSDVKALSESSNGGVYGPASASFGGTLVLGGGTVSGGAYTDAVWAYKEM